MFNNISIERMKEILNPKLVEYKRKKFNSEGQILSVLCRAKEGLINKEIANCLSKDWGEQAIGKTQFNTSYLPELLKKGFISNKNAEEPNSHPKYEITIKGIKRLWTLVEKEKIENVSISDIKIINTAIVANNISAGSVFMNAKINIEQQEAIQKIFNAVNNNQLIPQNTIIIIHKSGTDINRD